MLKKARIVFKVKVKYFYRGKWIVLARNIALREPVYYKESVMIEEFKKQYPKLAKKIPKWKENGFTFQAPLHLEILEWKHKKW